jgi:alpha-tubulin suppressor-like RCC1 family protein
MRENFFTNAKLSTKKAAKIHARLKNFQWAPGKPQKPKKCSVQHSVGDWKPCALFFWGSVTSNQVVMKKLEKIV